jgi:hypothetical protein
MFNKLETKIFLHIIRTHYKTTQSVIPRCLNQGGQDLDAINGITMKKPVLPVLMVPHANGLVNPLVSQKPIF